MAGPMDYTDHGFPRTASSECIPYEKDYKDRFFDAARLILMGNIDEGRRRIKESLDDPNIQSDWHFFNGQLGVASVAPENDEEYVARLDPIYRDCVERYYARKRIWADLSEEEADYQEMREVHLEEMQRDDLLAYLRPPEIPGTISEPKEIYHRRTPAYELNEDGLAPTDKMPSTKQARALADHILGGMLSKIYSSGEDAARLEVVRKVMRLRGKRDVAE